MYLFISSSELIELLCERLWSRSRPRGKSHPLIGWDTNAQLFFCVFFFKLHFYSMAIERFCTLLKK